MAFTLEITDGTTTVTLSATDALLTESAYQIKTPAITAASVTEQAEVHFIATMDAKITNLERLFGRAREVKATGIGAKVYVQLTLEGTVWRSEIYDGRVILSADWLRSERAAGYRKGAVIFTRAPFWEGAEAQIPLTNGNGAAVTTALNVYNNMDSTGASPNKQDGYIEIAAAAVGGDLPAPIKIEMESAATNALEDVILSINRGSGAGGCDTPVLFEGEDGTAGAGITASTAADAGCSGGDYHSLGFTADGTWRDLLRWALTSDNLLHFAGGWFRPVIRWQAAPAINMYVKIKIDVGGVVLAESSEVYLVSTLTRLTTVLEAIQIPPFILPATLADLNIRIFVKSADTGTKTVKLDRIHFHPMDYYRFYDAIFTPASGQKVIDDMIAGQCYGAVTAENVVSHIPSGDVLMVTPNQAQRIIYECLQGTIGDYVKVKIWYRPRRRVLV